MAELNEEQRARFNALFKHHATGRDGDTIKPAAEINHNAMIVLAPSTPLAIDLEVDQLARMALAMAKIETPEQYVAVIEIGKGITALRKKIEEHFKKLRDPLNEAIKINREMEGIEIAKLQPGEDHARKVSTAYRVEQERIAREVADKERERLRVAGEAARLEQAVAAEQAGKPALANTILNAPVITPKVEVKTEVPKVAGITRRVNWRFEILNPKEVPAEYLSPDEKLIRAHVNAHKDKAVIPGVRIWDEPATGW